MGFDWVRGQNMDCTDVAVAVLPVLELLLYQGNMFLLLVAVVIVIERTFRNSFGMNYFIISLTAAKGAS